MPEPCHEMGRVGAVNFSGVLHVAPNNEDLLVISIQLSVLRHFFSTVLERRNQMSGDHE